ncbi:hypothetical protein FOA43_003406 [Brettanomyces nanus]|uniref:O-acyltransferase n=1 Tax=Eeniella nana TaxID=13502 RepID=A0A875RQ69_EENNA|nr:uncharacterized protein FOA43_003406 [Brettanomyces nanus]QPG76020.1 hypothetical protein FOA43_003406 [Brettanomyces nanus]
MTKSVSEEGEIPDRKHLRSSSLAQLDKMKILERNSGAARKSIFMNDEYNSGDMNMIEETETGSVTSGSSSSSRDDSTTEHKLGKYEKRKKILQKHGDKEPVVDLKMSRFMTDAYGKHRYKPDGTFRAKFADLNFQARTSILDRDVVYGSDYFGLFVAAWFIVAMFSLNIVVKHYLEEGSLLRSKVFGIMMKDLWKIGLTDLAMYLVAYLPVILHMLIKNGWIRWRNTGRIIESLFETVFVFFFVAFADQRCYPWIGKIFLMLHSVVILMKTHSYAFYNGYMWDIKNELDVSSAYVKKHENMEESVKKALDKSISFCNFEMSTQAARTAAFPGNITFKNYFEYSMFPACVYEVSYPRNKSIRWRYVFSKAAGIFGIIFVLVAIAQNNMYPLVMKCLEMQKHDTLMSRIAAYPLLIIEMIPPFLTIYLLIFFLIWELILNAIAELSRFADREFYRYWWNSTDWNQYSRDWNVPVHKFLLRHVYHSSISGFHVSKSTATFITFLLSSLMHEVAMYVLFHKVRFYLLGLQMCQLPLVQFSKTKFMMQFPVLSNAIFWLGIVLGPSLLCTMYLVF